MNEYWAEGNSNIACRNFINNLNKIKLQYIIKIYKSFINENGTASDICDKLNNDIGIFFVGFKSDYVDDKEGLKRWDALYKIFNENSQYLRRTPSFESMTMYLLKCDIEILKKLLNVRIKCNKKQKFCDETIAIPPKKLSQIGGSNSRDIFLDFLNINPDNTKIIIKILGKFNIFNKNEYDKYDPLDTHIIQKTVTSISNYWLNGDKNLFLYCNRYYIVYDIWYVIMFLYKKTPSELNIYYKTLS
jgi:hypothetical protein